jgi:hypothetical protein
MNEKEYSPFTPGSPVPADLFVGRSGQITEVIRYIKQSRSGKQENIFLTADRGIGKSSLAAFIRQYVSDQENILAIHVFLGRVETLEELVRQIFDQLLKTSKGQKWFVNIAKFFGKYIQQVGLFGISVNFSPQEKDLKKVVSNFPEALYNLVDKIKSEKDALFIALDDINGLADKIEFANWYKSFVDEVATRYQNFPVSIMLIGLPEKKNRLATLQPSLMRIFRVVEIDTLSNKEVEDFLIKAFTRADIQLKPEALKLMVKYSSGLPLLMQEIGDATFWIESKKVIEKQAALKGIIEAASRIGQKYLDPKVYLTLRSERYRPILRKLGKPLSRYFTKAQIESRLNDKEKGVFHNFLRRLRELGIIELDLEKGRGAYRFINELYPVYIWLESEFYSKKNL